MLKIDKSQYGNKKGISTEHMMVNLMDKIFKLLDNNNNRSAVIASIVSYLSDRQMQVRVNNTYSSTHKLPGGGPQGTLLGLIEYFVQSSDNANCVDPDLRFKFVDDLTVLELVMMTGLLTDYNFNKNQFFSVKLHELGLSAKFLVCSIHPS